MHVATTMIVLIATWMKGDWKRWQKYHTTILFIAFGNLVYNFLTANYFLWRLDADFLSNHTLTEMLYTIIVFPGTVLMFLGSYPSEMKKQVFYTCKWIFIYIVWEAIFILTGSIDYQYGWSLWWSLVFLCVMFPILRLHHTRPSLAYFLSAIVAVTVLWLFDVPVHLPVEERSFYGQ